MTERIDNAGNVRRNIICLTLLAGLFLFSLSGLPQTISYAAIFCVLVCVGWLIRPGWGGCLQALRGFCGVVVTQDDVRAAARFCHCGMLYAALLFALYVTGTVHYLRDVLPALTPQDQPPVTPVLVQGVIFSVLSFAVWPVTQVLLLGLLRWNLRALLPARQPEPSQER